VVISTAEAHANRNLCHTGDIKPSWPLTRPLSANLLVKKGSKHCGHAWAHSRWISSRSSRSSLEFATRASLNGHATRSRQCLLHIQLLATSMCLLMRLMMSWRFVSKSATSVAPASRTKIRSREHDEPCKQPLMYCNNGKTGVAFAFANMSKAGSYVLPPNPDGSRETKNKMRDKTRSGSTAMARIQEVDGCTGLHKNSHAFLALVPRKSLHRNSSNMLQSSSPPRRTSYP